MDTKLTPFPIQKMGANQAGRDYIVGDVHGSFSKLREMLTHIGFSPILGDRLFHVGDLVDRGPESHLVLDWLEQPWVYSIQGNHEDMIIECQNGSIHPINLEKNGGEWFLELEPEFQAIYAKRLAQLPYAIELQGPHGTILIVHADIELDSWEQTVALAASHAYAKQAVINDLLWSRDRLMGHWVGDHIEDVYKLVCGHTPLKTHRQIGNRLFLDTGGWHPGRSFSIYDVQSDEVLVWGEP